MNKRGNINDEEKALFRDAVADVTPLKQELFTPTTTPPLPRRRPAEQAANTPADGLFSDSNPPDDIGVAEELFFSRPGLQHKVIRKLRRGHFPISDELDLHGLRVMEARQVLSEFLQHALARQYRVVRVIHGKGKGPRPPVLKGRVDHWLRQLPEVLAYCTCRPEHGGRGAIYILLRIQPVSPTERHTPFI